MAASKEEVYLEKLNQSEVITFSENELIETEPVLVFKKIFNNKEIYYSPLKEFLIEFGNYCENGSTKFREFNGKKFPDMIRGFYKNNKSKSRNNFYVRLDPSVLFDMNYQRLSMSENKIRILRLICSVESNIKLDGIKKQPVQQIQKDTAINVIREEISSKPIVLNERFNNVYMYKVGHTNKYKLNLYGFSYSNPENGYENRLEFYVSNQDLKEIVTMNKTSLFRIIFNEKNRNNVSLYDLDYVSYMNKSFISTRFLMNAKNLYGWGINMEDLAIDINNGICNIKTEETAQEIPIVKQENVNDISHTVFKEHTIFTKSEMLFNKDIVYSEVKKRYDWIKDDYINEIIDLVIDNSIINVKLPSANDVDKEELFKAFESINKIAVNNMAKFTKSNYITVESDLNSDIEQEADNDSHSIIDESDIGNAILNVISKPDADFTQVNVQNMDVSKLDNFVEAMKKAIIGEIIKKTNFPPNFIKQRIEQEACAIQYIDPKDKRPLLLKNAKEYNRDTTIPFCFDLGSTNIALFLLKNIFTRLATYEDKEVDAKGNVRNRTYYPFLTGNGKSINYLNGLIDVERYKNILRQNLTILYPGTEQKDITNEMTQNVLNYCEKEMYRLTTNSCIRMTE